MRIYFHQQVSPIESMSHHRRSRPDPLRSLRNICSDHERIKARNREKAPNRDLRGAIKRSAIDRGIHRFPETTPVPQENGRWERNRSELMRLEVAGNCVIQV